MTSKQNSLTAKPAKAATNLIQAPPGTKSLSDISGSKSEHFTNTLVHQGYDALWLAHSQGDDRQAKIHAMVAAIKGAKPQDELEGMLAAQLVAAHSATMECYRRAMIQDQTFEGRKENLNQANKLSRSYATLLQALNHYRGKGVSEQKVTVQHVHVSDGGQAIVGNVQNGSRESQAQTHDDKSSPL